MSEDLSIPQQFTIASDITIKGGVITENSSETKLSGNATFTGTAVDISAYATVTVTCLTDQAGTLYADFSPNGTNWDITNSYSITASTALTKTLNVYRKYFRVRMTNGGVAQTYMRIQSLAGYQEIDTTALDISDLAKKGVVDATNSTTAALNNGATFTGTATDVSAYPSVVMSVKTDQVGSLYADFSPDGTNWDLTLTFDIAADTSETHRITITRKYFRMRITNSSGSNQTYLRAQTILGAQTLLTSVLSSSIQSDSEAILSRSVLTGVRYNGTYANVPVTAEGHLEVAVHEPLLPFGSVHTEYMLPIFQTDAVYGLNSFQENYGATLSGTATASDSVFELTTGTTLLAQAYLQSNKRLHYRAGQGSIVRFSARYSASVTGCYQICGMGHAEDGVYFGYVNNVFGILHTSRGVREVRTFTVTTGSSTAQNVTITLNGVGHSVAVTNSGNIQRTVWELSIGTYSGWQAMPSGATVIFVSDTAGAKSGAYSYTASTMVGTFAQTKAGAAATETFIAQSAWNGDPLNGDGPSGITADWNKGNVFEIGIKHLGFSSLVFKVEVAPATTNNATWVKVHTIKLSNALTQTSFRNPSFPFSMTVYSVSSTTNVWIQSGSFAGFIEGLKVLNGHRYSYYAQSTSVGAGSYLPLLTVMNTLYFSSIANQSIITIISLGASLKHNSPCIIYLIRNGTLTGNPNFAQYGSVSSSWVDTTATGITFVSNEQLLWSGHMGDTGSIDHNFNFENEEFTLQPGEWITIAARTVTGNAAYVTASLNTREDQ